MNFGKTNGAPVLMASVGSLWLGTQEGYLNVDGSAIDAVADVAGPAAGSSIVFSGDFSFANDVQLSDGDEGGTGTDCATNPIENLLQTDEDGANMNELSAVTHEQIGAGKYLCIFLHTPGSDDAVVVPETGNYMVTTMHGGINDAIFPPSKGEHALGYVMRDGTTVQLSYLTTFPTSNQRIVIRNRNGADVPYMLSFKTEEDATATPGKDAVGMLPANSVTYLSMLYGDVVTLEGTYRVAGTLVVETEPRNIDVIVSQTNDGGSTDTVNYTPRFFD